METPTHLQERPQRRHDLSVDERTRKELAKRILKLRWMGLEAEAEHVEAELKESEPDGTIVAGPFDTD